MFTAFSARVTNLFRVIEEVAFGRIDVRLAHKLLELADEKGHLAITHQRLASELGSAREVISRQLHEFQRHRWTISPRASIELTDMAALERLTGST